MIYWLYELLKEDFPRYVNVLQYLTLRSGAACITAFLICLLSGNWVIRRLLSLKMGQPIRTADEVHKLHELHGSKAGTPTMGGVMILGSVLISTLLFADLSNALIWICIFVTLGLGLLGFYDDYTKVTKKSSDGVSARGKLVIQCSVALVAAICFVIFKDPEVFSPQQDSKLTQETLDRVSTMKELWVPFMNTPLVDISDWTSGLGWWVAILFFVALFAFMIIGTSNAVNLTDGLDGLAIGCTIVSAFAFGGLNYICGNAKFTAFLKMPYVPSSAEVTIFCFAIVGAGMGFLWFNCFPAKMFMGDTGSLALGGMMATVAICCKQEILLVIIGGVFVMEALSVILQVGSFKLTGRRIFRMAPIHHHFELKGWKESTVIVRFWILSVICALAALATLKLR